MRRYAIVLNEFALDLRIEVPFAGLVCPKVGKYKLSPALLIIFMVILSNHLGAMAGLVVRIIGITGVNHSHVESHLSGIVGGYEHLRLLLGV